MSETGDKLTGLRDKVRAAEVNLANLQARQAAAKEDIRYIVKELEELGLAGPDSTNLGARLDDYLRDIAEVLAEVTERLDEAKRRLNAATT